MEAAIQERIPHNHCWGCGSLNPMGLQIKSYWDGDETVCTWTPEPHFMAGPTHVMNGGIIATLLDCHSLCTAMAAAYRAEGRAMDSDPLIWYVTASMNIRYLRPTPIDAPVRLRARVNTVEGKKTRLTCTLSSGGNACATAEVLAVRVPGEWREE
ncbi:MAG: PaaI family thioesterase [Deltaproteobacteria bacterium]|nr:PaaI family thioesterase [Deltaproteobacteria bacterium]